MLKITLTTGGRKDLRKPLLVWINGMPEAPRGSMCDVIEHLKRVVFQEEEIYRLCQEFTETGHTALETDRVSEAVIRHALEPDEDIVEALRREASFA